MHGTVPSLTSPGVRLGLEGGSVVQTQVPRGARAVEQRAAALCEAHGPGGRALQRLNHAEHWPQGKVQRRQQDQGLARVQSHTQRDQARRHNANGSQLKHACEHKPHRERASTFVTFADNRP